MSTGESQATGDTPVDVPTQVFNDFLSALKESKVSDDVIARLHQTLLKEQKFSDAAIKVAVLGDGV